MNYNKLMRALAFTLMLSCMLAFLSGCKTPENEDLSDKQRLIAQLKDGADDDGAEIIFTAAPFAQAAPLSFMYSIEVKIVDGNVCLNDVLYESVEIVNNPQITYDETLLVNADSELSGDDFSNIMEKIKSSESCYMLETETTDAVSKLIAVYIIDSAYYFSSFSRSGEGEVIRIHCANMEVKK